MMGGGIGQSEAGRVIVVFERALRIALLLTSVVGERGVRLAFLPLPAVAGAIDRSQVFILNAGAGAGTEIARILVVFVIERELEQSTPAREAFEPFGQLA